MNHQMKRTNLGEGVYYAEITDPKFKHNQVSMNFILPLQKETASENAIIPFLLRKGCLSCPDFSALNARLEELYGATINVDVLKYNAYQILSMTILCLDNRYALEGEDLVGECARLITDMVLEPNFGDDGLFSETDLELERRYLIDSIEAEINEKRAYAIAQCIQHMCKGEPPAVRRCGYVEDAERITTESAKAAWERMIRRSRVEIIFAGCGDPRPIRELMTQRFGVLEREPIPCQFSRMGTMVGEVKDIVEQMDISQSKLVMGMRCASADSVETENAVRFFTAMYGMTPFSKLFLNVREKLGLCYYCAARFDLSTNLLLVDSGIEADNMSAARDEIMRQLSVMREGGFDEKEYHNTLLLMENSVHNISDNLGQLEGWYLSQIMRDRDVSPEQDVENLRSVTREQIISAAKGVSLDTVYFLTTREGA